MSEAGESLELLKLKPVDSLRYFRGIAYPARADFRQLVVTGPPGSGKTTQVHAIGGWPEEGYLDLTEPSWWRSRVLAFRPREVHLGFPFAGQHHGLALFDQEWMEGAPALELDRVQLPPEDVWWMPWKWRSRYVFEFLLPPVDSVFAALAQRGERRNHPIDALLTVERVRNQRCLYAEVARLFHRARMLVFVREVYDGMPKWIDEEVPGGPSPWVAPIPTVLGELARRLERLTGEQEAPLVDLAEPIRLAGRRVKILYETLPVELRLGEQRLQLHREIFLRPSGKHVAGGVLAHDPEQYEARVHGVLRLDPGRRFRIGGGGGERIIASRLPRTGPSRLKLSVDGHRVSITDLESPQGTELLALRGPENEERLVKDRRERLERLRDIFGGPLRPLGETEALASLSEACRQLERSPWRPTDGRGEPGGLVELPLEVRPILVGDLHAATDNLLTILSHNRFLHELATGDAAAILLGDAVHLDEEARLSDMESSLVITDLIVKLMLAFPDRFIYLRGTHESFSYELTKGGVAQGQIWKEHVRKTRGAAYCDELQNFYDRLAYVASGGGFLACHAGPPMERVAREEIIDIHAHQRLRHQITWNRLRTAMNPAGYTKRDVEAFKKAMGVRRDVPFIVAHSPRPDGRTVWLDLGGIEAHHLVFSGDRDSVAVFTRLHDGMTPLVYPSEPLSVLLENEGPV